MFIENLEEINSKLDPKEVLSIIGYEKSKPSEHGGEVRDFCPIHCGDSQKSLSISLDKNEFFCHSCAAKGDLIGLYMQATEKDLPTAVKELAAHFSIPVKYSSNSQHSKYKTQTHNRKHKQAPIKTKDKPVEQKKYTPEKVIQCWAQAEYIAKTPYFLKKQLITPPIAKFGKNANGFPSTQVPYSDIDGNLKYVLCISNGKYEYKVSDDASGAFALLGKLTSEEPFFIGEGIATVQTPWEAFQRNIPAVSCGSWGNIISVLQAIIHKFQNSKPIVLIDCDDGGKGEEAAKMIAKKFPSAIFRKPKFEGLPNPKNFPSKELKDFNDMISKCQGTLEDVKRQLEVDFHPTVEEEPKFHDRLGKILGDASFAETRKDRTYDQFEQEHKHLFSRGGLVTGYEKIDDQLYFSKGDFVVVQAMSNHGKSTFMLQLAYRFISANENKQKDPMSIFVTYESTPLRIEEKLINIIGNEMGENTPILYSQNSEEKYLYADHKDQRRTIATFNEIQRQNSLFIMKRIPLEKVSILIDLYKLEFPGRTICLFLDYFQIIETESRTEGWERIKEIAYALEKLAIEKEIIIFTASQVNDKRETREGRDLFNAATTVVDVFNHSHSSLKLNKETEKNYKDKVEGKSVCTLTVNKQKHGASFDLQDYFLFNGYSFSINTNKAPHKSPTSHNYF